MQSPISPGRNIQGFQDLDIHTPPQNVVEEFLSSNVQDLDQHVALLPYVHFQFKRAIVALEREISLTEYAAKRRRLEVEAQYLNTLNPNTGRTYGVDASKAMAQLDSVYQGWQGALIELQYRKGELEAYQEALKTKVAITPGLQGRFNKLEQGGQVF